MTSIFRRTGRRIIECFLFGLVMIMACVLLTLAQKHFYKAAYVLEYPSLIQMEAEQNNLSPAFVLAVIRTESGFNPQAQSSVQARGLMQITKATFEWAQMREGETRRLHFDDLFDSELNIHYGTAILRLLLEEMQTEANTLCAYHAGRGKALEWLANPAYAPDGKNIVHIPYGDTSRYVEKVMQTKEIYEALYDLS